MAYVENFLTVLNILYCNYCNEINACHSDVQNMFLCEKSGIITVFCIDSQNFRSYGRKTFKAVFNTFTLD